jgi:8-oxo-dGTP pyrophosphatase MutT (NUDIX family)
VTSVEGVGCEQATPSTLFFLEVGGMLAERYVVNVEGAVVKGDRYLMVVRGEEEYAPGGLNLPGGKVEDAGTGDAILEESLRREILEEVALAVHDEMVYVRSSAFVAEGDPVVDVVFLCRWKSGEAIAADPVEVAAVRWMTVSEAITHPETPLWTRLSLRLAEEKRIERGW